MAVIVMFSHIWAKTGIVLLLPFNKFVTIAVAFFFFASGFSMLNAYRVNEKYLSKIVLVKIPFLIYLAILAYVFSALFQYLLYGFSYSQYLPVNVQNFFGNTNWYIYELIGFYLAFVICMRFFEVNKAVWIIAALSIVAFLALYFNRGGIIGEPYYDSIFGYSLGVILNWSSSSIRKEKYKKFIIIFDFICIGISFYFLMFVRDHSTIWFAIIRNLAAISILTIVVYIIDTIEIKSVIMRYLSRISAELYIFHIPLCELLRNRIKNNVIYILVVIICSLLMASIFNIINSRIKFSYEKYLNVLCKRIKRTDN